MVYAGYPDTKFSIACLYLSSSGTKFRCVHNRTVPLLNSAWSSPKILFSKVLEVVSGPYFAEDNESGLRSDQGQVVLCDFSKLRF